MLNQSEYKTLQPLPMDEPAFEPLPLSDRAAVDHPVPDLAVITSEIAIRPEMGADRYSALGRFIKRTIDLVASLILLVLLSPLMLIIGVAIRATSKGPALFRQTRVGFNEVPFTMYKFRTMKADNDETAHREFVQSMLRNEIAADDAEDDTIFKLVDDPRITKIGQWLRRTSLDELPQLFNILMGQMSLVGPRPCIEYEVSEFEPHHRARALSVPGMTGLWQITGRNELHMREALDLDLAYVETCSLRTDLTILAKTVKVVAQGSGV